MVMSHSWHGCFMLPIAGFKVVIEFCFMVVQLNVGLIVLGIFTTVWMLTRYVGCCLHAARDNVSMRFPSWWLVSWAGVDIQSFLFAKQ